MSDRSSRGSRAVAPAFDFTDLPGMDDEAEAEVSFAPLRASAGPAVTVECKPAVDLADMAKVWCLIGRGRSGKTMLGRWQAELVASRGGQQSVVALDQGGRRGLADFVAGVKAPDTDDPHAGAVWAERWLRFLMAGKHNGLADFGGGDTILRRLVEAMPDLVGTLEAEGVAPVAIYLVGDDPYDLGALATLEAAGFRPRATAIVINEKHGDPTLRRADFRRVLNHSALKAAVSRGAQVLWMPKLAPEVAASIAAKRLTFAAAGGAGSPLETFDARRARAWSEDMSREFNRVKTWVPA